MASSIVPEHLSANKTPRRRPQASLSLCYVLHEVKCRFKKQKAADPVNARDTFVSPDAFDSNCQPPAGVDISRIVIHTVVI